jgi:homoaconitase/3-isopropylmalate dehydratase large subunit
VSLELGHAVVTATPPQGPDAARGIAEFHGEIIDQVIIGGDHSCGIEVLRHAAAAIKQRKLHTGLRCEFVPDSARVAELAMAEELVETLGDLGAIVHEPGTDPHRLIQPDRRIALTTIAAPEGTWRVGPFAAAVVACAGMLAHPERLDAAPQRDSKLSSRRPKST